MDYFCQHRNHNVYVNWLILGFFFQGLVSCFLHVHPNGASVDYIWSYLSQLSVNTRTSELEELLLRLPMLFKLNMSGVGAGIEKKWQFVAYSNTSSLPFSLAL